MLAGLFRQFLADSAEVLPKGWCHMCQPYFFWNIINP
jgi:hypothetical protein